MNLNRNNPCSVGAYIVIRKIDINQVITNKNNITTVVMSALKDGFLVI